MTRLIANLLILLVLFTHSTVAMDVRVCHDNEQTTEHSTDFSTNDSTAIDAEQDFCLDAGGHCSHNQAHTAGLVSLSTFSGKKIHPILSPLLTTPVVIHPQEPLLKPPKA
jgi:hypothetical protein